MRIIAVAMTKGGVGKTTTAVNLSHGLARLGHRVLLLDADTQGQCAKALGVAAEPTLTDVLLGEATILEAVNRARENLDLVASDHQLTKASLVIARRERDGHLALAEVLAPVSDRYDFVIMDAAPGVDAVAVNVLGCADDVLAPVALNPASLAGVFEFVRHVERVARHNRKLALRWILPTFHDLRVRQTGEMLDQLRTHFGGRMCTPIRVNIDLAEAFGWKRSIFEHAPQSRGAEDYARIVDEVQAGSCVAKRETEGSAEREYALTDD